MGLFCGGTERTRYPQCIDAYQTNVREAMARSTVLWNALNLVDLGDVGVTTAVKSFLKFSG